MKKALLILLIGLCLPISGKTLDLSYPLVSNYNYCEHYIEVCNDIRDYDISVLPKFTIQQSALALQWTVKSINCELRFAQSNISLQHIHAHMLQNLIDGPNVQQSQLSAVTELLCAF